MLTYDYWDICGTLKCMLCFKHLGNFHRGGGTFWGGILGRLLTVLTLCNLISELFEVFDQEPQLWCIKGVALAVLATYTWSFMQFTLVFTATAETVPDDKKLQEKVCN